MKKGRKLLFAGMILLICIISGGFILICCTKYDSPPTYSHKYTERGFSIIEDTWNQYANKYPPRFSLILDRGGMDANVIAALNGWLAAFHKTPDQNYLNELTALESEFGTTTFHKWEEFKKAHYRKYALNLTPEMSSQKIAEEINNYIGLGTSSRPQDYISAETVRTIINMNDLCTYFEDNKISLHEANIDSQIKQCIKLSTQGKYRALDALLK